jgi:hypothetical protein
VVSLAADQEEALALAVVASVVVFAAVLVMVETANRVRALDPDGLVVMANILAVPELVALK